MSKEIKKDQVIDENTKVPNPEGEGEQNEPPKDDDQKNEETKKEFFLIRAAKATARGCKKAGKAINGFVHKHPYISAGVAGATGYAVKMGVDYFLSDSDSVESKEEQAYLPPAEAVELAEDFVDNYETDDQDMPIEETANEE